LSVIWISSRMDWPMLVFQFPDRDFRLRSNIDATLQKSFVLHFPFIATFTVLWFNFLFMQTKTFKLIFLPQIKKRFLESQSTRKTFKINRGKFSFRVLESPSVLYIYTYIFISLIKSPKKPKRPSATTYIPLISYLFENASLLLHFTLRPQ
jgi:hypothetical protein